MTSLKKFQLKIYPLCPIDWCIPKILFWTNNDNKLMISWTSLHNKKEEIFTYNYEKYWSELKRKIKLRSKSCTFFPSHVDKRPITYCLNCQKWWCQSCVSRHKQAFKKRKVKTRKRGRGRGRGRRKADDDDDDSDDSEDSDDEEGEDDTEEEEEEHTFTDTEINLSNINCIQHPDNPVNSFCKTCTSYYCSSCESAHKDHKIYNNYNINHNEYKEIKSEFHKLQNEYFDKITAWKSKALDHLNTFQDYLRKLIATNSQGSSLNKSNIFPNSKDNPSGNHNPHWEMSSSIEETTALTTAYNNNIANNEYICEWIIVLFDWFEDTSPLNFSFYLYSNLLDIKDLNHEDFPEHHFDERAACDRHWIRSSRVWTHYLTLHNIIHLRKLYNRTKVINWRKELNLSDEQVLFILPLNRNKIAIRLTNLVVILKIFNTRPFHVVWKVFHMKTPYIFFIERKNLFITVSQITLEFWDYSNFESWYKIQTRKTKALSGLCIVGVIYRDNGQFLIRYSDGSITWGKCWEHYDYIYLTKTEEIDKLNIMLQVTDERFITYTSNRIKLWKVVNNEQIKKLVSLDFQQNVQFLKYTTNNRLWVGLNFIVWSYEIDRFTLEGEYDWGGLEVYSVVDLKAINLCMVCNKGPVQIWNKCEYYCASFLDSYSSFTEDGPKKGYEISKDIVVFLTEKNIIEVWRMQDYFT